MNITQINEALAIVLHRKKKATQLQEEATAVQGEILTKEAEVEELLQQKNKEWKDVERLQGKSVKSLFFGLIGNKEAKLEKEEQEYMVAQAAYESEVQQLELLQERQEDLRKTLLDYADVEQKYKEIVEEKKTCILLYQHAEAAQLETLIDQIGEQKSQRKEIIEAHKLGIKMLKMLDRILKFLDEAESWATADVWVQNSIYTRQKKYEKMETAKKGVAKIQQLYVRYRKELRDTNLPIKIVKGITLDEWKTKESLWFDCFFVDVSRRKDLREGIARMKRTRKNIASIQNQLSSTHQQIKAATAILERTQKELLESCEK